MDIEYVCTHAARPATAVTRRDVARALLAVPSGVALVALPDLRRAMEAAGNPLSPRFWQSARTTLSAIEAGLATVGDVQHWLESTGTEPIILTPSYFSWPEEDERGPVATEMHGKLVAYLEERVAKGEIDPDALAAGDAEARTAYEDIQERWLSTPLPDGRVPRDAVSDETDQAVLQDWRFEDEVALQELDGILAELPAQPEAPAAELAEAAARLRALLIMPGYPANVLRACAGLDDRPMPDDDRLLWLEVVAGLVRPVGDLPEDEDTLEEFIDLDGELSEEDIALANICALQHGDWLAGVGELVRMGPGASASPERIAQLIAEAEEAGGDEPDEDELRTVEELFASVVSMWALLGIVDADNALTPLGWWGLPGALKLAWGER
ncbi:hypothetical protein [Nonomuraea sp. NPDC049309]|uniref:hypothetical protein n=1 Tax=Nonomuraea sp. NPDC049309 TaxID=3364350 RepID=UPI00372094AD